MKPRPLRLDDHQYEAIDAKARLEGVSGNRYIQQLVEKDIGATDPLPVGQRVYREGKIVGRAEAYMRKVETGKVATCRNIQLAVKRSRETDQTEWVYQPGRVNEVIEFIEGLPHVKGHLAGQGETVQLEQWQVFILSEIFGWRRRSNPRERKHREYLVEVARKNGKSTLAAGLALWELRHGDTGGEVYSAATVSKQARVVFEIAQWMSRDKIARSDWNEKIVKVKQNEITCGSSRYAPVSKASKTLDGLNPSLVIVDEAAAIEDPQVISVMDTALQARESPLMVYITTAQSNRETAYYSKRTYLQNILSGSVEDERVGGLLYGLDEGDDHRDRTVWVKPNPNLNVSLIEESLWSKVIQSDEARDQLPDLLIKHFNVWRSGNTAWVDADTWNSCEFDWKPELVEDAPLFVGVDLAQTSDLCAITYLWMHEKQYYVDFEAWTTEEYIASLSDSIRPVYRRAVEDGKLHVSPGRIVDYGELVDRLSELHSERWIMRVGVDPYNAGVFSKELERRGVPVSMVNQSIRSLNSTTKRVRDYIVNKRLHHRGVEFMNWQVSNVNLYTDVNENVKLVKDVNSPHRKIDNVVALLCAMKVSEEHAVVEDRSTVRYIPI